MIFFEDIYPKPKNEWINFIHEDKEQGILHAYGRWTNISVWKFSLIFLQEVIQMFQSLFPSIKMVYTYTTKKFFQKEQYLFYIKNYFWANHAIRKSQEHYLHFHKFMDLIFSFVLFCSIIPIDKLLIAWYDKLIFLILHIKGFFMVWGRIGSLCDYKFLTFL